MSQIGKEVREITVEPLSIPVPAREMPQAAPVSEPTEVRAPVLVPAHVGR